MTDKLPDNIKVGVIDYETDPFKYGRVPQPFACEFYSDDEMHVTYGPDCVADMMDFLEGLDEPYLIYAHNGGKFDVHMMIEYIDNPIKIIKSRIVSCKLFNHTLRDSYAIIPVPLAMMTKKGEGKLEIDYAIMEEGERYKPKNKREILTYLHADCTTLYNKVRAFVDKFGPKLTVGGTAIKEIRKRHDFKIMSASDDRHFRQFYHGGRVQCFKSGIIHQKHKVYDLNSAYPDTMRNKRHPVNSNFMFTNRMPDNFDKPFFLIFEGTNNGAIPAKDENGELTFDKPSGLFECCSHELEVALKYGLVKIDRVIEAAVAQEWIVFDTFVDDFYSLKNWARENGQFDEEMFAKFMLNSGYGKFGTDPENFSDFLINRDFGNDAELKRQGYTLEFYNEEFEIWSRPSSRIDEGYFDVSIAASITSGTRATLLEGMQHAKGIAYCDTDSLICEEFYGDIDPGRLGAWKFEKEADAIAIGGKKLYALFDPADADMMAGKKKPVKMASKGGTIKLPDLLAVCRGETVRYENQAPTFSFRKKPKFVHRNFKMTVDAENGIV